MRKRAVVTGSVGQTGFYMKEYLLEKDYEILSIDKNVCDNHVYYENNMSVLCDISKNDQFIRLLEYFKPDEIYNFGGNSNNLEAFDDPFDLLESNTKPVITILNYIKDHKSCKFFQASSSLIFGDSFQEYSGIEYQFTSTEKKPMTPYGCSKLYAYNMIETYRKHYGIFAVNGILYNHESIRRNPKFIIPKIVKTAIEIKKGITDKLVIGNLSSARPWLHAKDVVDAAYQSLQYSNARDYIICADKMHDIRMIVNYVFNHLELDYKDYVKTNDTFNSSVQENNYLGFNKETKIRLGWKINYTIKDILNELIKHYNV